MVDCGHCGHVIRYTHHGEHLTWAASIDYCRGCIECGTLHELEVPDDDSDAAEEQAWAQGVRGQFPDQTPGANQDAGGVPVYPDIQTPPQDMRPWHPRDDDDKYDENDPTASAD